MSAPDLSAVTLDLIRISSPTGGEEAIADHVEKILRQIKGLTVGREGQSVWAATPRRTGRPWLGFFGHLDTVPAQAGQAARIEGDVIWGLGASDMKGALAVMLAMAAEAVSPGSKRDALFVFYAAEEGPLKTNGLTPLLAAHPEWKALDIAVCMEPTSNAVQMGCVGGLHAELVFEGKSAHSARPWEGINAIHMAADVLADLRDLAPRPVLLDGLEFREVMSATMARGGAKRNVIPPEFRVNVNYRFAPGKTEEQAVRDLEAFVKGRARVEVSEVIPSGKVCASNRVLEPWMTRRGLRREAKQAWTDVAQLSAFGVDAVNCGPGDGSMAHQIDERVSRGALLRSLDIMRDLLFGMP